jgi:hypothetical protein
MKKDLMLLAVLLFTLGPFALLLAGGWTPAARAAGCTPTGFFRDNINMTAALINPGSVTGEVNAAGCNIGVYYGPGTSGTVSGANIHNANYFGVVNDGGAVNIQNSDIHDIGESPFNGTQHGVAIYFVLGSNASGTISGNHIWHYQKGGIVVNGTGSSATIRDNVVTGLGPVGFIAQNGIQVGYGADASVMRNTVSGNSYIGTSTVSGGIVVVGGPYYGEAYTVGTQIVGNTVTNNDIGVFLTNLAADGSAPDVATNIKTVNNTISNDAVTNNYGGCGYQAGVSDVGNNDKIINNTISGVGYTPGPSCAYLVPIDADQSFTNRPKVHANK